MNLLRTKMARKTLIFKGTNLINALKNVRAFYVISWEMHCYVRESENKIKLVNENMSYINSFTAAKHYLTFQ